MNNKKELRFPDIQITKEEAEVVKKQMRQEKAAYLERQKFIKEKNKERDRKNKALRQYQADLKDVFMPDTMSELLKQTYPDRVVKCPRCYMHHIVVENYGHLCDRCWPVILKSHTTHWSVPHIKNNIKAQREKYGIEDRSASNRH